MTGHTVMARARCAVRVLLVGSALSLVALGGARAQSIDRQCLVSFDVKDRIFSMQGMSVSCHDIEFTRQGVLESLQRLGSGPAVGGLPERVADLTVARDAARGEHRTRARQLVGSMIGNVIALIGLKTCVPSMGSGCLLASLVATYSKVTVVDGVIDLGAAFKSLSALDAQLTAAERELEGRVSGFEDARAVLITDFNQLCSQVRKQCQ